jgi:hypothetical protein
MQFILLPLMAVFVHAEVDWARPLTPASTELQPEVVSLPSYREVAGTVPGLTSALAGFPSQVHAASPVCRQRPQRHFSTPWTHQKSEHLLGLAANLNGQGVDYVRTTSLALCWLPEVRPKRHCTRMHDVAHTRYPN